MQPERLLCAVCRNLFPQSGDDWYRVSRMHQDRTGAGPTDLCSRACAIAFLQAEREVKAGASPLWLPDLRRANVERCESPTGFKHPLNSWSPMEWAAAFGGEAGETLNKIKKLQRTTMYSPGEALRYNRGEQATALNAALEFGDTVIYGDLMLARIGMDMEQAIRSAFNAKSIEIGSDILI